MRERTIYAAGLALSAGAAAAGSYFLVDHIAHGRYALSVAFALLLTYLLLGVRLTWRAWRDVRPPSAPPPAMRALGWAVVALFFTMMAI
jgi:hypothetical protein